MLVNEQPIAILLDVDYDETLPVTCTVTPVFSQILPNRAKIMEFTKGAVDVS
jgi:hypothetical protein